jgi:3-phenylpropionate/trans-cinnamate dioxygenase ferredoxin reductase component
MNPAGHVVVVGASAAGLAAAETLRREGFGGDLTLVGAEPHLPYDRPPLSKQVLQGMWEAERTSLRRPDVLDRLAAAWRLGASASRLDPDARRMWLSDGSELLFDGLVIATGVSPRRLSSEHELSGVHELRTVDDALGLRSELIVSRKLVIVGAGLIGCEVAASARQMGVEVTVVDALSVPMERQLGPTVGGLITALHEKNGVEVLLNAGVHGFSADAGHVTGVDLTDGSHLPADLVLVAIGSVPNTQWLSGSGLTLADGVECDEFCRAAPGIVAAGDVASWYHSGLGQRLRIEHRTNAIEQGTAAARALLHADLSPFTPVPYFWTDQFDVKVQVYGIPGDGDEPKFVHGGPLDKRFAVAYRRDGHTTAILTWNMPREALKLRAELVAESDYYN